MYVLASIGLIGVAHFAFSFVAKTPMGLAPLCAIAGGVGLVAHMVFAFYSGRVKRFLLWAAWVQSAILIALAFYVGGALCQQ